MRKIIIGPGETQFWKKLDALSEIDPAASSGIGDVVYDGRRVGRGEPLAPPFEAGYEEIYGIEPGLCLHIVDLLSHKTWRCTATGAENNLRLRVAFAGGARYRTRNSDISDQNARCVFIIRPGQEAVSVSVEGGRNHRYCALSITETYLHSLNPGPEDLPNMLLSHWDKRETVVGHFPLSRASLGLAARLFSLKTLGAWRDLQVRALSLELLRLLFADWRAARSNTTRLIRLNGAERDKLAAVRKLIESDPAQPLPVSALCKRFQMNRNKLHFGFKRLFGVSIHSFQNELRMEAALKLLVETSTPINEVAELTGYSEPTNFTAAFKKHFAVLPSEARKGIGGG